MEPQGGQQPGTGLHVRDAQEADQDLLVRNILAVARESEGEDLDKRTVARGVQEAVADPEHRRFFIIERDEQAVGSCLVTTEWSDWNAAWYWWLQSIYIEKEHRGKRQGVLRALLDHIHQRAQAAGIQEIKLYVHQENTRAVQAYEGQGYRRTPYFIYQYEL